MISALLLLLLKMSALSGYNLCWDPVQGATEYRLYQALMESHPESFCDAYTGECWTEQVTTPAVWTDCVVQVFDSSVCDASSCCAMMEDPVWSAYYFMTAKNNDPGSESLGAGRTSTVLPCP